MPDDLHARVLLCKILRNLYGMRIDPRKHTYEQLKELQKRRVMSKKLIRECCIYMDWRINTAAEIEKKFKEMWVD